MSEIFTESAIREIESIVERMIAANQPSSLEDDEGIDAKEVARMLGYFKDGEPNTWPVYELARRGVIESFRPSPGVVRFNRGKIRRFVEQGGCAENAAAS